MKRLQKSLPTVVFAFGLLILMAACAAKPNSVAKKYFKALEQRDYDEAREYVSASSITNFNKLFQEGKAPANSYTIVRVEMDESSEYKAKIYYTENGDPTEKYIEMEKVEGDWRIVIPDLAGNENSDYK